MESLKSESSNAHVYLAAITSSLGIFSAGAALGWASPTLPKLLDKDSPIKITEAEGSWIVSLTILGVLGSPVFSTYLVDKFGRKITLLIGAIPFIIGWILIIVANSAAILYAARLIFGIGVGIAMSTTPIYLGEIAPNEVRGAVGIIMIIMIMSGELFSCCIAPYVSIEVFAEMALAIPIIFIIIFIWFPESPYYLLYKNRPEDAKASLQRLRGHMTVETELENMQYSVESDLKNRGTFKEVITSRQNLKTLMICLGVTACQMLSGLTPISSYSETILTSADGSLGGSESTIIIGAVKLLASVVTFTAVDRLGRRPLLLTSSCGMGVTAAIVGIYFYLKDSLEIDVSNIGWLPLATLIIYVISYSLGLGTVPFALVGELFPTNIKAVASSLNIIVSSVSGFTVTILFQVVVDSWGIYWAFWIFTIFMVLGTIFIYLVVPETKGKSFVQIQAELHGDKYIEEKV